VSLETLDPNLGTIRYEGTLPRVVEWYLWYSKKSWAEAMRIEIVPYTILTMVFVSTPPTRATGSAMVQYMGEMRTNDMPIAVGTMNDILVQKRVTL